MVLDRTHQVVNRVVAFVFGSDLLKGEMTGIFSDKVNATNPAQGRHSHQPS